MGCNAMSIWEKDSEAWMGLRGNFKPVCMFHPKEEMSLFNAKIFPFKLHDNDGNESDAHAIDVCVVCPLCGYGDIYGVAIHPDHFDETYTKVMEYAKEDVEEKTERQEQREGNQTKQGVEENIH
jgi:hypothetical protein